MTPEEKAKHLNTEGNDCTRLGDIALDLSTKLTAAQAEIERLRANLVGRYEDIGALQNHLRIVEQSHGETAKKLSALRAATARLVQELESRGVRASQLYALEAAVHAIEASK